MISNFTLQSTLAFASGVAITQTFAKKMIAAYIRAMTWIVKIVAPPTLVLCIVWPIFGLISPCPTQVAELAKLTGTNSSFCIGHADPNGRAYFVFPDSLTTASIYTVTDDGGLLTVDESRYGLLAYLLLVGLFAFVTFRFSIPSWRSVLRRTN